jgi:hypothetical protein
MTLVLTLNLLLCVFDRTMISVEGSSLDSAAYSIDVNGGTIYLGQPTPLSPFGFRSPRVEQKSPGGLRILFLGNSYVAGSGSTFATNYPQAVEDDLKKLEPGKAPSVFSAGVNGYGVVEDRLVYEYLVQQGYHFDTVVLNFMLGSDPTNDVPQTLRTAIAGQAQRLHQSWFLRAFYPLDTTLFRFAVYLNVTFNQKWTPDESAAAKAGPCKPAPDYTAFSMERASYYYSAGAQKRIDMDFTMKEIDALNQDTRRHGADFRLVLLPDSNALLEFNRARFDGVPMDWDWIRQYIAEKSAGKYPLLDLSDTFLDRPAQFRCSDTHWTDDGNLLGAKVVADYIARNATGKQIAQTISP